MSNYARNLSGHGQRKAVTPQSEVIPGRESEMAKNNAGGFTFTVSPWDQLDRFLILGTEGGTYYASERDITKENLTNINKLIREDGPRVVARVVEISDAGRAPKNDPALFVLAIASAADNEGTRKAAIAALPKVARIGTHLFHYAAFVEGFRGWGRALRNGIANWYLNQPVDRLANQAIKYQARDGWSHRDLLRLAHPEASTAEQDAIFRWIVGGMDGIASTSRTVKRGGTEVAVIRPDRTANLHPQVLAFEDAKKATSSAEIIRLILDHDLPREAIPTSFLTDAKVWEALLENMPMTAMIRNLATMTRVGLLTSMSDAEKKVKAALSNEEKLRKARIHPISVLAAMLTYKAGRGLRGSNTWTPIRGVVDALDGAFYKSFGNVEPTGKNTLLALDVSGSMDWGDIAGMQGLTPRIASAAMALVTANVEESYEFIGFTSGRGSVTKIDISPRQRLDDVIKTISALPMGGTDCALPMIWAQKNLPVVDSFAVYTDNETWAGTIQPSQALRDYRDATGRAGKLAVVGMTATNFTIADPKDTGMMDVVGFDTAAPQLMSDFFRK